MNYKSMLLTQHLGLPEDASDEAIQQAHDAERAARGGSGAEALSTAACAERDAGAWPTRGRFRAAAVNAQLDAAINAGRLSAAEREGLRGAVRARLRPETLRATGRAASGAEHAAARA